MRRLALAAVSTALVGCAGGAPLLHPAHVLDTGVIRASAGVSANVAVGSVGDDLATARAVAAADPTAPGAPGSNPAYAKGALVAAVVAPGLAPFVGARVGIGNAFEGGLAYTGRGARLDMRRAFGGGAVVFSAGVGLMSAFYGRGQGSTLPGVDLASLHGYGADVPLLVGWRSAGGLYQVYGGARLGIEHDTIETLTSEPKSVTVGLPPTGLSGTRYWGGGVFGIMLGFRHVHVALELDAAYQSVVGDFNATHATVSGVSLTPGTALSWTF